MSICIQYSTKIMYMQWIRQVFIGYDDEDDK